ncbi:MAG: TolC family protein [Acidobacteriota bacterium]|jgi:outer membrane protein TolC|nr:TolC family protein [Acidobacteriota bacterium]
MRDLTGNTNGRAAQPVCPRAGRAVRADLGAAAETASAPHPRRSRFGLASARAAWLRVALAAALFAAAHAPLSASPPAPDAQPALPLSLRQAVAIALAPDGNARALLARESARVAEAQAAQSRAALLPHIDGAAQYQDFTRSLRAFGMGEVATSIPGFAVPSVVGPVQVYDFRLGASQSVFDFSAIRRFQSARASAKAAREDSGGVDDQVAAEVARAYLSALRAEALLEVAWSNRRLSEELLRLAENRKAAGDGTGLEVARAGAQLANDEQALEVATNDLRLAHLALLRVMGLGLDTALALTDKLAYAPAEAGELDEAGVGEAVEAALQNRPELRAQAGREDSARLQAGAARWERLPSLSATGDYGSVGTALDSVSPTRVFALTLKIPLFDGGRREAVRAEADARLRGERIRTRDVRAEVESEVRQAMYSLRSAEAQYAAAREGLRLAEQEMAHARRRYDADVATGLEVTDAQARLARARANLTAALYNHNLARVGLGAATGTIRDFVNR